MGKCATLFFLLSGVVVALVARNLIEGGFFKTVKNINNQKCSLAKYTKDGKEMLGLEDGIVFKNIALFSSDDRSWLSITSKNVTKALETAAVQGNIFLFNLTEQPLAGEAMTLVDFPHPDFHPHGISSWPNTASLTTYEANSLATGTEKLRLFVVNHRRDGDHVEVFDVDLLNRKLHYVYSVFEMNKINHLRHLNDVEAIGKETFLVTNWLQFTPGSMMSHLETFVLPPSAYVVNCHITMYEGAEQGGAICRQVAREIAMPNGVRATPDGRYMFVASTRSHSIMMYETTTRDPYHLVSQLHVGSSVDNIDILPNGDMLVATHPQLLPFLKHTLNHSIASPSEVIRIDAKAWIKNFRQPDYKPTWEIIFQSTGEDLPASSVGLKYQDQLLVGAVFHPGILVCDDIFHY
eukprot:TRINITY_DN8316_c0_g2_i1.p1 TRINITY_DN8316_c0_g2~~TRINITY_DN8316_c0_g2_i1.p1  ORF type:complete len:407 (+),score=69.07 TRINITY_DN8316_c0_g2_i1:129-1349(+)